MKTVKTSQKAQEISFTETTDICVVYWTATVHIYNHSDQWPVSGEILCFQKVEVAEARMAFPR